MIELTRRELIEEYTHAPSDAMQKIIGAICEGTIGDCNPYNSYSINHGTIIIKGVGYGKDNTRGNY